MWDVLKNEVASSGLYAGQTVLGERLKFNTARLARKNLLKQPRVFGVDGEWNHDSITATQATGYDGESQAWNVSGTSFKQSVATVNTRYTLSFYIGYSDETTEHGLLITDSGGKQYYSTWNSKSGYLKSGITNELSATEDGNFSLDDFSRVSISFTPTMSGALEIKFLPDGNVTLDAFQLEKGAEATAFEDPELYEYDGVIERKLVCDRCGFPVKDYPSNLKRQGGFMVCPECFDEE